MTRIAARFANLRWLEVGPDLRAGRALRWNAISERVWPKGFLVAEAVRLSSGFLNRE
jgi:hypothetical protein